MVEYNRPNNGMKNDMVIPNGNYLYCKLDPKSVATF